MNDKIKQIKKVAVSLGDEKIYFTPESKKKIDIEILILSVPLFLSIFAFAFDYLSPLVFILVFYALAMRIFIGNHDRYHADGSDRLPGFLEKISESLAVVVTPWDEPYDSIRKKHLRHHATHGPGKSSEYDLSKDPHSVYELGGIFRVFLSCLFYEELQLILDIKNNNISKSRIYRFFIFLPLQIAFILGFGWFKYFIVFLAMRIVGFTAWFVFSWFIHQPFVYKFGFTNGVPKLIKIPFAVMHGNRVTEGCLHHATHHAWPGIPFSELNKFDKLVVSDPEYAPDMRPIGS